MENPDRGEVVLGAPCDKRVIRADRYILFFFIFEMTLVGGVPDLAMMP
jgi:hypothetical protein